MAHIAGSRNILGNSLRQARRMSNHANEEWYVAVHGYVESVWQSKSA